GNEGSGAGGGRGVGIRNGRAANVLVFFEDNVLDPERREVRCKGEFVAVEPQVFDLLMFLIQNRDRVVSKDDLIAGVWEGRIVSDSTLPRPLNSPPPALPPPRHPQPPLPPAA